MALIISVLCLSLFSLVCLWRIISDPRLPAVQHPHSLTFRLAKDHSSQTHNSINLAVDNRDASDYAPATLGTRPTVVYKPRSFDKFMEARFNSGNVTIEWDQVEVEGPDVEDRHTLQQLAMMSGNAYALPGQKNWYDLDEAWNTSLPFGWEDTADGFRGHVFVSEDNSTVILSIKGTTLPLQGPTSKKDKFNDNLLFSCCCARVDITWIFATALVEESLFYSVGVNLYSNLTSLYPSANIWLTGHSLGGALAALLGTTFGVPAVSFESPGERLAASRLHLPMPPKTPITHVYHNADPIPQGACTGIGSPQYGWRADVFKHTIKEVISTVLADEREWEPGRQVPLARDEDEDCIDCYKWEFGDLQTKQEFVS